MFNKLLLTPLTALLIIAIGCSKSDNGTTIYPPAVTVASVSSASVSGITQTTATAGGNVTADGNASVSAKGVVWSTAHNPTISDSKTSDGTGTGVFVSSISGLTAGTTYYARAYATNSAGTSYGSEMPFTTLTAGGGVSIPTLSTTPATSITSSSAASGGSITSDGGASITARGIAWGTTSNPTTSNNIISSGTGTGTFVANLSGLTASTTYHIRAYATNSAGTAYGNDVSFSTPAAGGATTTNISIVGFAFSPSSVTIHVGDIVKWTNNDGTPHTVTATGGAFNSGNLSGGATYSYTATATGTFTYFCAIHPSMTGTITVIP